MAITPPSAITVAITPLPQPPQTSDPANFDVRADAFVLAEQVFSQQVELARQQVSANALVSQNNAQESANSAAASAAQVSLAAAQVGLAADQVALAQGKVTLATAQADRATEKAGEAADTLALIQNIASGVSFSTTSTTSNSISAGSKTWTVDAGESFVEGMPVYAVVENDPTRYLVGVCTAYSGTTLVVAVSQISANTGTFNAWNISIGGIPGTAGAGLAAGGAINQILRKKSAADYDTEWSTLNISDIGDTVYSMAVSKGPNWKKCDGSVIGRASYPEYSSLQGTPFNVDSTNSVITGVINSPSGDQAIFATIKAGSLWIAATTRGRFYTSPDFVSWTLQADLGSLYGQSTSPIAPALLFDGTYVSLITSTGYVARSADGGLSWSALGQRITALYSDGITKAAAAGGGLMICLAMHVVQQVENDGSTRYVTFLYVLTSPDGGMSWNAAANISLVGFVGTPGELYGYNLSWSEGRFYFSASKGENPDDRWLSSSTNGTAWTTIQPPSAGQYYGSGAIGSRFYLNVGSVFYTDNLGANWVNTGVVLSGTRGTFYPCAGNVVYLQSQVFGLDFDKKTAHFLGYVRSHAISNSVVDPMVGTISGFNASNTGTSLNVYLCKPFSYDVQTQTVLPVIAAQQQTLTGGKNLTAYVKVL